MRLFLPTVLHGPCETRNVWDEALDTALGIENLRRRHANLSPKVDARRRVPRGIFGGRGRLQGQHARNSQLWDQHCGRRVVTKMQVCGCTVVVLPDDGYTVRGFVLSLTLFLQLAKCVERKDRFT